MDKSALQYLVDECGAVDGLEIQGRPYTSKPVYKVKAPEADTLEVRNLSALVVYLKDNFDQRPGPVLVQVATPTRVIALGQEYGPFRQRDTLIMADCTDLLPETRRLFGNWIINEEFQIWLRTGFTPSHQRGEIAEMASAVTMAAEQEVRDDGVKQEVTVRQGVKMLGKANVPNPVKLAPFRTFLEIEQPASDFLFRVREGGCFMLKEADGGAWRLEAMRRIKEHLQEALESAELGITVIS